MCGDRKKRRYPVLSSGNEVAITNKEKADMTIILLLLYTVPITCLKMEEETERKQNLKTYGH